MMCGSWGNREIKCGKIYIYIYHSSRSYIYKNKANQHSCMEQQKKLVHLDTSQT